MLKINMKNIINYFKSIYKKYKNLNNTLSIPSNYFHFKLKYYVNGVDMFHDYPSTILITLKLHIIEDIIFNFFYQNYPKSKLSVWLIKKRIWGDVKIITDGYQLLGYKRFRFFGKRLIYVEDCFVNNKGVTSDYLIEQSIEIVSRDWDFRIQQLYYLKVVTPVSRAFMIHAFAPEKKSDLWNISKWDIQHDVINFF